MFQKHTHRCPSMTELHSFPPLQPLPAMKTQSGKQPDSPITGYSFPKTKLRQLIADRERTESVTIIYFQPDDRKEGGSYVTVTGQIKKIDDCSQKIFLTDGTKIDLGRIVDIK